MAKLFNQLQGSHDLYTVFHDFLEIGVSDATDKPILPQFSNIV